MLWCSTLHHHGRSSSYHRDLSVVTFWLEFGFNLVIAFLFCYAAPAPRSCNGSKPPRSNAGARVRTRALQNPTSALRCWESYGAHDRFYNQKEAFTKYRPCTPVWLFPMPAHKRGQFCWTYFWEHVECSTDMEVLAASERWDVIHDSSLPAYICGTFRSRNIYKPLPAICVMHIYRYILGHIKYKCQGNIFGNHAYSHLPPSRRLAAGYPFSALATSYRWAKLMGKYVWNELISLSFSNKWPLCNLNGRMKHGKHQKIFE